LEISGAPALELHVALKSPYVYEYETKLCRTQTEVILNVVNPNVHGTGKEKPGIGSIRSLKKLGDGQTYDRSCD
jgi:hypothetical protein